MIEEIFVLSVIACIMLASFFIGTFITYSVVYLVLTMTGNLPDIGKGEAFYRNRWSLIGILTGLFSLFPLLFLLVLWQLGVF
jgi:hypothetical protein